jgi:hypothetical protein
MHEDINLPGNGNQKVPLKATPVLADSSDGLAQNKRGGKCISKFLKGNLVFSCILNANQKTA